MTTKQDPREVQPDEELEQSQTDSETDVLSTIEGAQEPEQVDWEVRAKELADEKNALEHKLKSSNGQRNRSQAREERLDRMEDSVRGMSRQFAHLMAYQSRDDPELAGNLEKARTETSREISARAFESHHQRIADEILDLVQDGDELLINDEDGKRIQALWSNASKTAQEAGDISLLYEVKLEAQTMVSSEERKRHTAELKKVRDEASAKAKKKIEQAGVHDQDTGPALGGGGEILTNREKMAREIGRRGGNITTT